MVGWIDDRLLPIPVNIDTVNGLFDETIKTEDEMEHWLKEVQVPCGEEGCRNAEEMAMSRVGKVSKKKEMTKSRRHFNLRVKSSSSRSSSLEIQGNPLRERKHL